MMMINSTTEISKLLKDFYQFKRMGSTYYKLSGNNSIIIAQYQRSYSSAKYYINLGCLYLVNGLEFEIEKLEIFESWSWSCRYNTLLNWLAPEYKDLHANNDIKIIQDPSKLKDNFTQYIIPFMEKYSDLSNLQKDFYIEKVFIENVVWVHNLSIMQTPTSTKL